VVAAPRRVIEVVFTEEDLADLERISRSRTEPASHIQRARILLTYRQTPSLYAAGRAVEVTHQTVERCLRRARTLGVKQALDDSPRPGCPAAITDEARTFVTDLACRKPKDLGYPYEVWTMRLLAEHVRENAPAAGYAPQTAIKIIFDNHSAHKSKETKAWLATRPEGRFTFMFTPKHGSWLNIIEEFFSKLARSVLRHIRVASPAELRDRILHAIDRINRRPVVHTWK
jgi:transposase